MRGNDVSVIHRVWVGTEIKSGRDKSVGIEKAKESHFHGTETRQAITENTNAGQEVQRADTKHKQDHTTPAQTRQLRELLTRSSRAVMA